MGKFGNPIKCLFSMIIANPRFLTPFGMTKTIRPYHHTTLFQMFKLRAPHETRAPIHETRPLCGAQLE
jgi:hypothetical protein